MREGLRRCLERSRPLLPLPTGLSPAGGVPKSCRAVLFDVYGTLFVSASGDVGSLREASRGEAFSAAMADCGLSWNGSGDDGVRSLLRCIEDRHRRGRSAGRPFPEVEIREIWRELVGHGVDDETIEELALSYEIRTNPTWPMPGLAETIAALVDRGLTLGIVSNAQFYTPLLFERHLGASPAGLGFLPEACIWSHALERAKPDPVLFQQALDALRGRGIDASQVLYVGNDMRNDVAPAARLGMRTALFAGDARSLRLREGDPSVAGIRPDLVVTELSQLR